MRSNRKRSFTDLNNDNDTQYEHHDGKWGTYIGNKRRKLVHQFREDLHIKSNIFSNQVIWINGRTVPPLSELKELIVSNGGIAVTTLTGNTTAIIADNLPMSKLKQLNKIKSNLVVSTPQWILKSIESNKLLNPANFPLSNFSNKMNKNSIKNYQTAHFNINTNINTNNSESNANININNNDKNKNNQETEKSEHDKLLKVFGTRSTLTDPNFVENFFKSSRLHFIGSFKQIYEEILPDLQLIKPKYDTINYKKQNRHKKLQRNIIHIDMDCYFVSVALRNKHELIDKPCVVCHSQNSPQKSNKYKNKNTNTISASQSTSEISSANYIARKYGIAASMLLGKALKLCPDLIVLPYKFDDYVIISKKMYEIFFTYSNMIQYKSIDEGFIEFPSELHGVSIIDIANAMRKEIFDATQCPCSAGISCNILLSQMATKKAKPNGTFFLNVNENKNEYQTIMDDMNINTLPGIGWKLQRKFNEELGIFKCCDLRKHNKWNKLNNLQSEFGNKIGLNIYNYLNGIDNREIEIMKERKSIGAEIGWGVRFQKSEQLKKFINDLSLEVSKRMNKIHDGLKGKQIHIRVKTKHPDADNEPYKFLGHGWCNTVTRSVTLNIETNDYRIISKTCWNILINQLNVDYNIVRAIGIQLSKLNYNQLNKKYTIENMSNNRNIQSMFQMNAKKKNESKINKNDQEMDVDEDENKNKNKNVNRRNNSNRNNNNLPAFSQIDQKVLDSLPRDIQIELSKAYKQQLLMRDGNRNRNNKKDDVIMKLRSKFSKSIVISNKVNKKKIVKKRKRNVNRDKKQKKLNVFGVKRNRNNVLNEQKNKNKNERDEEEEEIEDDGSLFGEESFDEYRNELLQWMRCNNEPNKSHELLLNLYIDDCINFDRLENVVYVLKYLKRFAMNNINWNDVSLAVIKWAQNKIQEKYKYKLQL